MHTIHKFMLPPYSCVASINMPAGAHVLSAHEQRGNICIWASVNPSSDMRRRVFRIIATGQVIEQGLEFVGTVLLYNGSEVYHVFEDCRE